MSTSSKIKGKKHSRKANLIANQDSHFKLKPYGLIRANVYSLDDKHIVDEVNKKHQRQLNKKIINEELYVETDSLQEEIDEEFKIITNGIQT